MKYRVTIEGRTYEIERLGDELRIDGETVEAEWADEATLLLEGRAHDVRGRLEAPESWVLRVDGERVRAEVVDERGLLARAAGGGSSRSRSSGLVRAPMPGLVVRIEVSEGDRVEAGQGVAIVEAMKMENELKAPAAGVVGRVQVEAGSTVEKDQILLEIHSAEEAE